MRERISRTSYSTEVIMIIVGIVLVVSGFYGELTGKTVVKIVVGLALIALAVYSIKKLYSTVEFDEKFLYIKRGEAVEEIPLANIFMIKLTMFSVNYSHFWKIKYIDTYGQQKAVRFLPKWDMAFQRFKDYVKEINHDVKIKNWSWTFDFDQ